MDRCLEAELFMVFQQAVTQEILKNLDHDMDKNTSCSSCSYSTFFCSSNLASKMLTEWCGQMEVL